MRYEQIREGMDVFDIDNKKIGTVDGIFDATTTGSSSSGGGYMRVSTGFLGIGGPHHIPFSMVRSVEGDRVYVNFAKERLNELGYNDAPSVADRGVATSASETRGRAGGETLKLREEELVARKRTVETGRVQIGKEVVAEQRTVEVPVTREEVTIERHPVDRHPSDRPIEAGSERSIEVPVREERVEIEKQPVTYAEVNVGKRHVTENQSFSDTVRREEARVERTGDVNVRGAGRPGGWERAMPHYRDRWQSRYGASAGRWEDFEPAYRYGYELRDDPEYRGRNWLQVEPHARMDWERRHPDTPWERARERVREAWEDTTA